ncbi:FAD-binding oxidoreductase [Pseudoclavibacter sp. AY1F1]|uniref:FAD-binding oxidoreductase n=1 Tax=Pseudoclavibacter sp. AY1F1 TaxID=2080583 RepID=UPI000CE7EAD4|nr:FAD-binding oxidoreductase [Pseudoclavibacter sp. AY1F1]PPF43944.1 FAD-binding oxidoreductase [Pseudoclavibacter sp. AY1F1]
MLPSRSSLSRSQIVERLTELLTADQVITDKQQLLEASVDRFRKYTAVHGIYDGPIPAAIVLARSTDDVSRTLAFANEHLINVVPRTGRTATEGGLETIVEDTIVLDGSQLDRILDVDETNMMVTAQCGVPLQRLEDELRVRGLTTGHSPQSKPIAQMGGLVATRSIGQFSTLYGGIEDMVVGLEAVFADGHVARIKNVPRRAAGPDIRHIAIGNEGALCVITEVTVKVFKYQPESLHFQGFLLDEFAAGVEGLRRIVTEGYKPSVCRVYSEEDAAQHFSHFAQGKCVVVVVSEGPAGVARATDDGVAEIFASIPHTPVDPALIATWFGNLNWGQDKIDAEKATMLAEGHLGYTTEVSINWSGVPELYDAVMTRIRTTFPRADDLTMLGAHSSHSYQTGTNLYFVYDYKISCEPRREITEYHEPLNAIIVEEALRLGGSMVHHHGIGKYRTPWTLEEHGTAYPMLAALKTAFDPNGIMNAGTIFPVDAPAAPSAEK